MQQNAKQLESVSEANASKQLTIPFSPPPIASKAKIRKEPIDSETTANEIIERLQRLWDTLEALKR